ncbi:MAG: DUF3052 family protein [Planctomycetota bacterium]
MARGKPTGYSGTPLAKKLGLKPGTRAVFVGAPDHLDELLDPLPEDVTVLARLGKELDYVHLFAPDLATLERRLPACVRAMKRDGMLWISWPKKTSRLFVDVTGGDVREAGLAAGLVDTKVCAVDEDWSGHRFCYRVADR